MLADRIKSEKDATEKMPVEFAAEYKLDGERVQIHKQADKIIFALESSILLASSFAAKPPKTTE